MAAPASVDVIEQNDDPPDLTPTDFEIEDRERRALIELAELEQDERNG